VRAEAQSGVLKKAKLSKITTHRIDKIAMLKRGTMILEIVVRGVRTSCLRSCHVSILLMAIVRRGGKRPIRSVMHWLENSIHVGQENYVILKKLVFHSHIARAPQDAIY
jgi:hypothetical protein